MPLLRERLRALQLPLGSTVQFGAASYAALALTFVQGLLLARILGPQRAGVWLALQLVLTYGVNYHLGVNDSVQRQLPMLAGQGRADRAAAYARSAAGLLRLLTLGWVLVGTVVALTVYRDHRGGALTMVACTGVEVWGALAVAVLKAHSRFGRVGAITLARAALTLALLPLAWRFGLPGVYARQAILAVVLLWISWRALPVSCAPRRDTADWRQLLHDGMPLLAVGFTFGLQVSLDRVLVAAFLGTDALGQYYLAAMLLSLMIVLPGVVAQTAYPEMLQLYGATGSPSALRPRVLRHSAVVAVGATIVAGAAALLLPVFTHAFLPRYVPGIRAAQCVLPGIVALSCSLPCSYFLQTVRRQRLHLLISAMALAVHVALVAAVARQGRGILGVAVATSVAYGVYALGLFVAFRRCSRS